jgi:hypothetical protein
MTTERDDGGPAFPARPTEHLHGGISITAHHGMLLRDYFAAKAMQGLIVNTTPDLSKGVRAHHIAEAAYKLADEMLKARKA